MTKRQIATGGIIIIILACVGFHVSMFTLFRKSKKTFIHMYAIHVHFETLYQKFPQKAHEGRPVVCR